MNGEWASVPSIAPPETAPYAFCAPNCANLRKIHRFAADYYALSIEPTAYYEGLRTKCGELRLNAAIRR